MTVPAAGVLFLFRKVIFASSRATKLYGVGFACFVLAAVSDLLTLPAEEGLEVLATVVLLAAMLTLGLHHTNPNNDDLTSRR